MAAGAACKQFVKHEDEDCGEHVECSEREVEQQEFLFAGPGVGQVGRHRPGKTPGHCQHHVDHRHFLQNKQ